MRYEPSREHVEKIFERHSMDVLMDNGLYRHLRFSDDGSSIYAFNLVTWPGYLSIQGDIGGFVFARLPDMFQFFRRGDPETINPDYWSEKLQSTSPFRGHEDFSFDLFRKALFEDFKEWRHSYASWAEMREGWRHVRADILDEASEMDEGWCRHLVAEFTCPITGRGFQDFSEHRLQAYTYQFILALRAIVWGIARYDENKSAPLRLAVDAKLEEA